MNKPAQVVHEKKDLRKWTLDKTGKHDYQCLCARNLTNEWVSYELGVSYELVIT